MNLGIESYLPEKPNQIKLVSTEEFLSSFVDFNDYCERCDAMYRLTNELLHTFNNITDIVRTTKKHPSTEALNTIASIFPDLKGKLSYESLKEKGKAAFKAISDAFWKAVAAIKGLFARVMKLLPTVTNRINALSDRLKSLDETKYEVKAWSYNGIPGSASTWRLFNFDYKTDGAIEPEKYRADVAAKFKLSEVKVQPGKAHASLVVKTIADMLDKAKARLAEWEPELQKAKNEFQQAQTESAVAEAKKDIAAINNMLILYRTAYGAFFSTSASILSNCKITKKGEAK